MSVSIFRYPGGKSKKSVRKAILSHFPKTYSEYRECMVGGGGIFFYIPQDKKRWINDLDENLISVYLALKDRPAEFIKACRAIEKAKKDEEKAPAKSGKALYNKRLKEQFDIFAKGGEDIDPALRYLFVHRTVWAGRVNYDKPSRMYFSNPSGWNVVFTKKIKNAAECMKDVRVTCGSYKEVLLEDGEDVVIYIDPPYYVNTELAPNSRLYKHNFEKEHHDELRDVIKHCKHKVVISYDAHPYIKELYKDFKIEEDEWTYSGTSSVVEDGQQFNKKIGKELIITNF